MSPKHENYIYPILLPLKLVFNLLLLSPFILWLMLLKVGCFIIFQLGTNVTIDGINREDGVEFQVNSSLAVLFHKQNS